MISEFVSSSTNTEDSSQMVEFCEDFKDRWYLLCIGIVVCIEFLWSAWAVEFKIGEDDFDEFDYDICLEEVEETGDCWSRKKLKLCNSK